MILRISDDFQRLLNFLNLSSQLLDFLLRLSDFQRSVIPTLRLSSSRLPIFKKVLKNLIKSVPKKQSPFKERGLRGAIHSTSLRPHFPSIEVLAWRKKDKKIWRPKFRNILFKSLKSQKQLVKYVEDIFIVGEGFSEQWGWCVSRVGEVFLKGQANASHHSTWGNDDNSPTFQGHSHQRREWGLKDPQCL